MKFTVTIECDNAAFFNPDGDHDPDAEVASILENLCLHLRDGGTRNYPLYDTNGNRVGSAEWK